MSVSTKAGQEKIETKRINWGHRTIHTEIIINAKPEEVWTVLTDTKNYPKWAKFLKQIDGDIRHQGKIDAYFQFNDKKDNLNKIHHTISVTEGQEFSWSEVFMAGIKDFHRFIVEPTTDGKTRFIQSDEAKGGLAWLLGKSIINLEKKGYPKFNRSLRAEVERRYSNK